jgi:hypothetical protein
MLMREQIVHGCELPGDIVDQPVRIASLWVASSKHACNASGANKRRFMRQSIDERDWLHTKIPA